MTSAVDSAPAESIRKRYAATLATQFVQMGLAAVTASFVPRLLGPVNYGNYNFLLTTSQTLRNLLEPSVQQAFYTFSAQDRASGPLTKLYGLFLLGQFSLTIGIIVLSALAGFTAIVWPGQALDQILVVTFVEWVLYLAVLLRQLGDSKGVTVRPQAISLAASIVALIGILLLVVLNRLDMYTYVAVNLTAATVSCVALGRLLLVRYRELCWLGELRGRVKIYLRRWWRYARPIVWLEYVLPLLAYISTYLVQIWYGSAEQAYFSLAYRWSALVLVFTSSAMTIVWREIANALASGEPERAAYVYVRFNRFLFALTLTLCVWLSFSGGTLVLTLAGEAYRSAVPVFMIMAFYPLQQTYGQINTIALKAGERTREFRNITLAVSIPDLILTYVLLAPPTAVVPGLGLGAIGIALRLVGFGLISVQLYERANFKAFSLAYGRMLLKKAGVAVVVVSCGVVALIGLPAWLGQWQLSPVVSLGVTSGAYFALIGLSVMIRPSLTGLSRAELATNVRAVRWKVASFLGRNQTGG